MELVGKREIFIGSRFSIKKQDKVDWVWIKSQQIDNWKMRIMDLGNKIPSLIF